MVFFLLAFAADAWLREHFQEATRQRVSAKLSGHYILCGFNAQTESIVKRMADLPDRLWVFVDAREDIVRTLNGQGRLAGMGDPSNPEVLKVVNVHRAKALIAALEDAETMKVVLCSFRPGVR